MKWSNDEQAIKKGVRGLKKFLLSHPNWTLHVPRVFIYDEFGDRASTVKWKFYGGFYGIKKENS